MEKAWCRFRSPRKPAHAMKTIQSRHRAAFTLVELMATITIVVILAALVVSGIGLAARKQAAERASLQLALLGQGLEDYKRDMGTYPVSQDSASGLEQSSRCLYQALFLEGYEYGNQASPPESWEKATTIYVGALNPVGNSMGWVTVVRGPGAVPPPSAVVRDPWGTEYRYRSAIDASGQPNPQTINQDFDLWSSGPDYRSVPGSPSDPDNKDDIRNFSPPPADSGTALPQPLAGVFSGKALDFR
ncbi:MAG: prepilin-type N-terminal cleavage/methylation domain-containing protein [Verrucomicrobiaceae bacterium]|nr:MAG: prepilin-type N-terminal cleavage/methylation domain-containing protein [Verrucomicrobiaceae bacterium]